jgi:hypothetical protein
MSEAASNAVQSREAGPNLPNVELEDIGMLRWEPSTNSPAETAR